MAQRSSVPRRPAPRIRLLAESGGDYGGRSERCGRLPLRPLTLLHPVAEAELGEDVCGMVSVVPQLAPELLREPAGPQAELGNGPCGESRAPSSVLHAGRSGYRSRREIAAVFLKDTVDAVTAHTVQKKDLRLSRRLPASPGVVQARVRPVVGGDRPPHRDLSPHGETEGVQPHFRHQMALLGLADDLELGCIFTE